jgi:hypothetical protein
MDTRVRRQTLFLLAEEQGWKCYYCEGEMTRSKRFCNSPGYPSLERLVEGRDGGRYVASNMVAACRSCNSSRPYLRATEWKAVRLSLAASREWPPCHAIHRDVSRYLTEAYGYPTGAVAVLENNPLTP